MHVNASPTRGIAARVTVDDDDLDELRGALHWLLNGCEYERTTEHRTGLAQLIEQILEAAEHERDENDEADAATNRVLSEPGSRFTITLAGVAELDREIAELQASDRERRHA